MEMMLFTPLGLDHIVLQVKDQAVAQKFYTEVLGCKVERVNPDIKLIQLRFGDHMIDLIPGEGAGKGLEHFCLSIKCDNLEALRESMSAQGIKMEDELRPRSGAYGRSPSFYFRDPDNFLVELKPR
jgi:glyoxylase I family protein